MNKTTQVSNIFKAKFFKALCLIVAVSAICFMVGTVSHQAHARNDRANKKVILISIDGMRPEFYLEDRFVTPTLKALRDSGTYALGAEAVFPTLTYPNHTTLITGVFTNKHGVLSNNIFTWQKGVEPGWYWENDKIKSPTLHQIAQAAGLTTGSVRWPVTVKATNVNYLVPEIFSMPGYYQAATDFDLTVQYTDSNLMKDILSVTTLKRYDNEDQMDQWVGQASNYIIKSKTPDLMTIHLANVDHVEHGSGREAPEVLAAVASADAEVKQILDTVDMTNTCVIITGDHGFADVSQSISPNVVFKQKGWITVAADGTTVTDWKVIAHSGGGQAAIYVKDKSLLADVTTELQNDSGKLGFHIIDKAQLNKWNSYPDADLAIEGNPGYTISGGVTGSAIGLSSVKGNHGYSPENPQLHTGFIATGCGIPAGVKLDLVRLVDIAPTIANMLQLSGNFDGKPIPLFQYNR